jgi:multidrug resistance protein
MTSAIQTPNIPSAPPIGKVLVPVFLIVFTDIMGFGLMIPLLPFYAEHFGASAFTVGLLLSVFAFCQLLAGPPLGQLSDRIGRKPVLVISQIGTLAGYILLALSNTLWLIFVARIIDGLTAGNISVAQAYVSDNTQPQQRTKAFGIVGAAFGLGMLVGPSLGGLLARHSLTTPIWGACVLSALSIVATSVLLPKGIKAEHKGPSETLLPVKPILDCFRDPATGGIFFLLSLFYFVFNTFISGFALFLAGRVTWGGGADRTADRGVYVRLRRSPEFFRPGDSSGTPLTVVPGAYLGLRWFPADGHRIWRTLAEPYSPRNAGIPYPEPQWCGGTQADDHGAAL